MYLGKIQTTATGPTGTVACEIQVFGRDGTKSPEMWVIVVDGKRITPFEQRVRGWTYNFHVALLKWMYRHVDWVSLLRHDNPFLKMLPKEDPFAGKYIPVPLIIGQHLPPGEAKLVGDYETITIKNLKIDD